MELNCAICNDKNISICPNCVNKEISPNKILISKYVSYIRELDKLLSTKLSKINPNFEIKTTFSIRSLNNTINNYNNIINLKREYIKEKRAKLINIKERLLLNKNIPLSDILVTKYISDYIKNININKINTGINNNIKKLSDIRTNLLVKISNIRHKLLKKLYFELFRISERDNKYYSICGMELNLKTVLNKSTVLSVDNINQSNKSSNINDYNVFVNLMKSNFEFTTTLLSTISLLCKVIAKYYFISLPFPIHYWGSFTYLTGKINMNANSSNNISNSYSRDKFSLYIDYSNTNSSNIYLFKKALWALAMNIKAICSIETKIRSSINNNDNFKEIIQGIPLLSYIEIVLSLIDKSTFSVKPQISSNASNGLLTSDNSIYQDSFFDQLFVLPSPSMGLSQQSNEEKISEKDEFEHINLLNKNWELMEWEYLNSPNKNSERFNNSLLSSPDESIKSILLKSKPR